MLSLRLLFGMFKKLGVKTLNPSHLYKANVSYSRLNNMCICIYRFEGYVSRDGVSRQLRGKESACHCKRRKRCRFDPWVGKILWRRAWQPITVFLPGKYHGGGAWWATVHRSQIVRQLSNWATEQAGMGGRWCDGISSSNMYKGKFIRYTFSEFYFNMWMKLVGL